MGWPTFSDAMSFFWPFRGWSKRSCYAHAELRECSDWTKVTDYAARSWRRRRVDCGHVTIQSPSLRGRVVLSRLPAAPGSGPSHEHLLNLGYSMNIWRYVAVPAFTGVLFLSISWKTWTNVSNFSDFIRLADTISIRMWVLWRNGNPCHA